MAFLQWHRFFRSQREPEGYTLLPPSGNFPVSLGRLPLRRGFCWGCIPSLRTLGAIVFAGTFLVVFAVLVQGVPPSFSDLWAYERALPQHHGRLQGESNASSGKELFLRFPSHATGKGINNVLQEAIMFSMLAELTGRAYVFDDFIWSRLSVPYTLYNSALRPTRMPINAYVGGQLGGGAYRGLNETKLSVSTKYYSLVCSPDSRVIISSGDAELPAKGDELMAWWVAKVLETTAPCLEIEGSMFDFFKAGEHNVLSIFPLLQQSATLKGFDWSPLVTSALSRNFALFPPPADVPSSRTNITSQTHPVLPGVLAVHIRRGDFEGHCTALKGAQAVYTRFCQFGQLPDRFQPDELYERTKTPLSLDFTRADRAKAEKALARYYRDHCFPEIEQIVLRLRKVREEYNSHLIEQASTNSDAGGTSLSRVYILTNGKDSWVRRLQASLEADGWLDTKTTADLTLDKEQNEVSVAVDMVIAQRSEVFVGNGFSSLTSNVALLKVAQGSDPQTMRFL